jgi:hypothetical protein
MPSYKLTFGDRVITYMGHEGYLSFGKPPIQRYEISLFKSSNGLGVSAGTVSMPFSAFDEIGIRCCWENSRSLHGSNWLWFPVSQFSATTGQQDLTYLMSNDSNYYIFQSVFKYNNTANTFNVPNDQASQWWGMYSPINTNATIAATNNGSRHKIIGEIVGVKYQ